MSQKPIFYKDGVYTGVGKGFQGDMEVQVTVEGGHIADIAALSHKDDKEFFNRAQSSVIQAILAGQSLEVNPVSGATYSSNGLIEAVAHALDRAGLAGGENLGAKPEESQQETSKPEDGQPGEESKASASPEEPREPLDLSGVPDGVYEGTGTGYQGVISVKVVVEGGAISDVTIKSYEDDGDFISRASDSIVSQVVRTQSLDMQAVSGATFSSNGIAEAIAHALGVGFQKLRQPPARERTCGRRRRLRERK